MNPYACRIILIAVLASGPIFAACTSHPAPAQTPISTFTDEAVRRVVVLAQAVSPPTASAPVAPVVPPPPAPAARALAPEPPVGLPHVRDYEAIPELRDIYFDSGMAVIRPSDAKILNANAAWLRANPDRLVLIEGHCDNRGLTSRKNEFNMALGERRAQAAMNHLIAQGVQPSRITILSYGEERPVCTEQSERCWSKNRHSRFLVKSR
jgi:peptidoglycan-associated lipoprotein